MEVFSAPQTADLPKSTLDSGGLARHLVRKGTRGLNYGSIIISSRVVLCRQHVDTSHHFTGCLIQKVRSDTPQMSRTSRASWMKRVCCWPHNRVHPLTDSTEGTVEIFSLSSFKNNYCSMFRASYLRKKNRNIKQCSFISCVQIESISVGTALTMKGNMHSKFNIWFMLKNDYGL